MDCLPGDKIIQDAISCIYHSNLSFYWDTTSRVGRIPLSHSLALLADRELLRRDHVGYPTPSRKRKGAWSTGMWCHAHPIPVLPRLLIARIMYVRTRILAQARLLTIANLLLETARTISMHKKKKRWNCHGLIKVMGIVVFDAKKR